MQGSKIADYPGGQGRVGQEPNEAQLYARSGWRAAWQRMCMRRRTRAALARLDAMQLRDIGLTREQAQREAGLPFWR